MRVGNRGNKIDLGTSAGSGNGDGNTDWILLQPELDFRTYGHANIYSVQTGRLKINLDALNANGEREERACRYNPAIQSMSKEQVGRAMDVLRFLHHSMGGDDDDDLEDYYLGSSTEKKNESDQNDLVNSGASAGRHAEGHYTQFIDDDEERGEGGVTLQTKEKSDKSFRDQLESVLDDPSYEDIIRWSPHGHGFRILDAMRLMKEVAPHFEEVPNIKSFYAQLNAEGFTRFPLHGLDNAYEYVGVTVEVTTETVDDDGAAVAAGTQETSMEIPEETKKTVAANYFLQQLDEDERRDEYYTRPTRYLEQDEYNPNADDANEYSVPRDPSILVQTTDLVNAARIAFRAPLLTQSPLQVAVLSPSTETQSLPLQTIIDRRHRDAIGASTLLAEFIHTWSNKSSICTNTRHGVRVTATTSTISTADTGGIRLGGKKYRFAYRIRVENINDANSVGEDGNPIAVQLLGRTWNIYEFRQTNASLLAKLLEEGSLPDGGNEASRSSMELDDNIQVRTLVSTVNEPKTGAVGHFPVIRSGEVS